MRFTLRRLPLLLALLPMPLQAAEHASIPEPLTLQQALHFASQDHPRQQLLQGQTELARIRLGEVESAQAMTVDLKGRIRWKTLQQNVGDRVGDHQLALVVEKPLYDFGRTAVEEQIARDELGLRQQEQLHFLEESKLQIMERFFQVLLADLQRTVDDEAMTIAYLRFKKMEDKEITGEYSDLDLLRAESRFEDARAKQKQSELEQRLSRIRLAEAMNRPGELPGMLLSPTATPPQLLEEIGQLDQIQQQAMEGNWGIGQAEQQIRIAQNRVEHAEMEGIPELDAAFELLDNSRVTSTRDRWRASLLLEVPLLDGGTKGHEVAAAREELRLARIRLESERRNVGELAAQYYLELNALEAQWRADQVAEAFSDIELDRNRALYELERQSNFGDALVGVSASHLRSASSRFAAMLTRARLDQLIGKEIVIHE